MKNYVLAYWAPLSQCFYCAVVEPAVITLEHQDWSCETQSVPSPSETQPEHSQPRSEETLELSEEVRQLQAQLTSYAIQLETRCGLSGTTKQISKELLHMARLMRRALPAFVIPRKTEIPPPWFTSTRKRKRNRRMLMPQNF